MSILVLTMLCVYVHYNALGLYIKLFALYKNMFFIKVIKTENWFKTGFQQPKSGFPKNPVLTSLNIMQYYNAMLYNTMLHNTMQHNTIQIQYSVQYNDAYITLLAQFRSADAIMCRILLGSR